MNSKAIRQADDQFYKAHPELIDPVTGQRKPLTMEPKDAKLRAEWMAMYRAADNPAKQGFTEGDVGCPATPCPKKKLATLTVTVLYTPLEAPVKGATVKLSNGRQQHVDSAGVAVFKDLEPGDYKVDATYTDKNPVVEAAVGNVGSRDWAYATERGWIPANSHKCNLFVYEMETAGGSTVPKTEDTWRLRGGGDIYESGRWTPPLAKEWASPANTPAGWTSVSDPEPGDVIAQAVNYSDASGHSGIVSYPEDGTDSVTLAEGDDKSLTIKMKRRTVYASETIIKNNNLFWDPAADPDGHYVYTKCSYKRYGAAGAAP